MADRLAPDSVTSLRQRFAAYIARRRHQYAFCSMQSNLLTQQDQKARYGL
jgi:hypothetical protein